MSEAATRSPIEEELRRQVEVKASEDEPLVVVDLFAGAGGMSTGFAKACEDLGLEPGVDVELYAINHWEDAIQTHEQNHPWATHYHARVEELYPPDIVDPERVDVIIAGPECTHFSNARGGKPVSDQRRASAWHVLDWIEKLQPEHILIENVPEFRNWGPIEDGVPSQDGTIFERWIGMFEALGYSIIFDEDAQDYGVVLNAADYGDPQRRKRLFIMGSRSKLPTRPPQTHSSEDDDLPDQRPAADIIDWNDLGESIWTRDLENPRVTPLAENTMRRIAEGIRRHCSDEFEPLADAVEQVTPDRLREMREHAIPLEYADVAAQALEEPFLVRNPVPESDAGRVVSPSLVKYYGTSTARPVDEPVDTVTADGNHHALSTPTTLLLGQHSNSVARDPTRAPAQTIATGGKLQLATADSFCLRQQSGGVPVPTSDPLSTVAAGGAIGLTTVASKPLIQPKNGSNGDLYSNIAYDPDEKPFQTVITDSRQGHVLTPSLVRYSHGGAALSTNDPMPTVATEKGGTFALTAPYLCPLYNERPTQAPRTRDLGRPLMTVPSSKAPAAVTSPFLVEYYGNSTASHVEDPVPTVTTRGRFALVVPEHYPWGLDIRYRMLQPDELKKAQGFPDDYEITGSSKKTQTGQIGNAVPVNLARNLVRHLLSDTTPSLTNYGGGIQPETDVDVPSYEEVASDD